MTTTTTDRPTEGTRSTTATGGSSRPAASSGNRGTIIVVAIVAILVAIVTGLVVDHIGDNNARAAQRARDEREALTDLNNRVDTQEVDGRFVRAFYVGDQMRAEWLRNDNLKRCVMPVKPPTDKVKRWTAQDVPENKSFLENIEDPDAIGGLEAEPCGAIGVDG